MVQGSFARPVQLAFKLILRVSSYLSGAGTAGTTSAVGISVDAIGTSASVLLSVVGIGSDLCADDEKIMVAYCTLPDTKNFEWLTLQDLAICLEGFSCSDWVENFSAASARSMPLSTK